MPSVASICRRVRWRLPSRRECSGMCAVGVDVGLIGCLFLTPLALGGRHDLGRFLYVLSVAIATLSTLGKALLDGRSIRLPAVPLGVAVAAVAVCGFQLLPLPAWGLAILAPGHTDLLPMWREDTVLGTWRTISLAPAETAAGLAMLIAHSLLFFVVYLRTKSVADVKRLLAWIAAAGLGVALLAAAQQVVPSERFLWVYDYPNRSFANAVQGTFANRNHLAHFLIFAVAALAPVASWPERVGDSGRRSASTGDSKTRFAAAAGVVFLLVLLLATQSRGGAAALAAATCVAACLRWLSGRLGMAEVLSLVVVATLALAGVSMFGYEKVTARLGDLVSGEIEQLDSETGRRLIWEANIRAFVANPLMGHGAGSHRFVYPAYIETDSELEYTHAESGYLQIASENGAAGILVLVIALGVNARWVVVGALRATTSENAALWSAIGAGLAASTSHSVVDFVWYVPALAATAIVLASLALRLLELQREELGDLGEKDSKQRISLPRRVAWLAPSVAVSAACFSVVTSWGPASGAYSWDRFLRTSKTIRALEQQLFNPSLVGSDPHLVATVDEMVGISVERLEGVVSCDSRNARAHARLAGRLMQRFEQLALKSENPQTIVMVADAVGSGGFESPRAVCEWLLRAFGENAALLARARVHAETAVRLCPLQGESYQQLASLDFLAEAPLPVQELVDQAVRVSPVDGCVLFQAGQQTYLSGEFEQAFDYYRECIRLPGSHRRRLVASLSRVMPAEVFLTELRPDCAATDLVLASYQQVGSQEDLIAIAEHVEAEAFAEGAELSSFDAARRWRQVSIVNRSLERYDKAVECSQRAYELLPYDFWVRHELASSLYKSERFAEADPHLRWCLARRPDIRYLQGWLKEGAKRRTAVDQNRRRRLSGGLSVATRPTSSSEREGNDAAETSDDTMPLKTPTGEGRL